FRRLDTDGDGKLSGDELPTALRADLPRWGADRNGAIGPDEFRRYFAARVRDARTAPTGAPNGARPAALPAWFADLDADRDGQVALHEWRAAGRPTEEFRRMDRDGDGLLTPREVLAFEAEKAQAAKATAESPVSGSRGKTTAMSGARLAAGGAGPSSVG